MSDALTSDSPDLPGDPLVGKTLGGRYLVKSLLDRGGMGKVYVAEQQPLGRLVALKTLDLTDPKGEFQQRFFNEASTASRLRHPNTVRIFDYGRSDDGVYFLTMELLEGRSFKAVIKGEAPMSPLRVAAVARQVCGALHEAHESGIVHRDLKPGNIFLTDHHDAEFAKVLDFGLVKDLEADVSLSHTGQALGSPLYMSPEQVEGEKVDRRADIYALGLVMYVALTGKVPFKKGSVATVMMQHLTKKIPTFAEMVPDLDIHPSIEWVVRRCIEKDRDDRFATMRDVSVALKLAVREMRGEVGRVPWALGSDGSLDIPEEFFDPDETVASGVRPGRVGREEQTEPLAEAQPAPEPEIIENSLPSSPTLTQSRAGVAAGAALAGTGLVTATAGILLVLLLGGVGIYAVFFDDGASGSTYIEAPPEPVEKPEPPKPPVEPAVVEPAEPEPADEPEGITVTLSSEPPGAEVLRDGAYVGTTPHPVRVTGEPVKLTLDKPGYRTRDILVDGTVAELTVPLRKQRTEPRPTQPAQPDAPKPVSGRTSDVRDPWED